MMKKDLVGEVLVAASSAIVAGIVSLVVQGQVSWLFVTPAFLVPFIVLFLYQGTGVAIRSYKEYKIREGELIPQGGKQNGDLWEFEHGMQEDLGFYGPYIALPRGKYRAKFRLKIDGRDQRDERICDLDVTANSGQKWFAHQSIAIRDFKQSEQWQDFSLDFTMANDENKVEFRARMNDVNQYKRRITFDKVAVHKRLR